MTGDLGIKQAQDNYQRLMNNKSPKSNASRIKNTTFAFDIKINKWKFV